MQGKKEHQGAISKRQIHYTPRKRKNVMGNEKEMEDKANDGRNSISSRTKLLPSFT